MKQIVLLWDSSLTGATLARSLTSTANSITCEITSEPISDFTTANDTLFQTTVGRYAVAITLSTENFNDSLSGNANYKNVMRFLASPVRRIKYMTTTTYPDINGYDEFNSDNTINMNVDRYQTIWRGNRRNRSITMTLISEQVYNAD